MSGEDILRGDEQDDEEADSLLQKFLDEDQVSNQPCSTERRGFRRMKERRLELRA